MPIYKDKNSKFWYVRLQYNNTTIRQSTKTTNKTLAKNIEGLLRDKLVRGEYFTAEKADVPFQKFVEEEYIPFHASKKRSFLSSDKVYFKHLLDYFKDRPLAGITYSDIEDYQAKRLLSVSGASVNRELSCLRSLFNKASEWNSIKNKHWKLPETNPVKYISFSKESSRARYLNKEEIKNLLGCSEGKLKSFIVVAINTGLRKGEIQSIKKDNVDFNTNVIILPDTKSGVMQSVPMNGIVKSILNYYFESGDLNPFNYDPRTSFETARKQAGIPDVHIHDLRHTFATMLLNSGEVDAFIVSRLLRHSSFGKLQVTSTYMQVVDKTLHKAVAIIERELTDIDCSSQIKQQKNCQSPELQFS